MRAPALVEVSGESEKDGSTQEPKHPGNEEAKKYAAVNEAPADPASLPAVVELSVEPVKNGSTQEVEEDDDPRSRAPELLTTSGDRRVSARISQFNRLISREVEVTLQETIWDAPILCFLPELSTGLSRGSSFFLLISIILNIKIE